MKIAQRFDYARLAEVLQERGLVDNEILRELLHASHAGGAPFPEALVDLGHVGDWDLSQIVCEIFHLPFLPVGAIQPDSAALEGLNVDFLRQYALVPLGRFGSVLTLAMPGIVPADVLGLMAAETDLEVLPVVGSPKTNRAWVDEHLAEEPAPEYQRTSIFETSPSADGGGWAGFMDEADEAVMKEIGTDEEGGGIEFEEGSLENVESAIDAAEDLAVEAASLLEFDIEGDAGSLEVLPDLGTDGDLDVPDPTLSSGPLRGPLSGQPDDDAGNSGGEDIDLPPLPDFGS